MKSFVSSLTAYSNQLIDSGSPGRLTKDWAAPIYAFFRTVPSVEYDEGRRLHIFQCAAQVCKHKTRGVRRFLDKGDAKSTGNLRKHAKRCWGEEIVAAADKAKNASEVRQTTIKGRLNLESITAAFERTGKGKVSYSHWQHTTTESRCDDLTIPIT